MTTPEHLRNQADLRAVAGEYVTLEKRGPAWWGVCPFHREDTASFKVQGDQFHCFGCGLHGDVFDFLKRIEGISFPAAVELLADRLGIPLEQEHLTRQQIRERRAQAALAKRLREEAPLVTGWMRRQIGAARAALPDPHGYRQWRLWVRLARADAALAAATEPDLLRLYAGFAQREPRLASRIVTAEKMRGKRLGREILRYVGGVSQKAQVSQ